MRIGDKREQASADCGFLKIGIHLRNVYIAATPRRRPKDV